MLRKPDRVTVTRQAKGMRDMMGGMMGGATGAWMIVWGLLSLAVLGLAVVGGVWAARTLAGRRASGAILPPDVAEAQAVLRRRYAAGEITREDYLQAKVELEMT
jgi:putative membrane protein